MSIKRVLVKSVFDTFDYVMQHYYPAGLENMVVYNRLAEVWNRMLEVR